MPVSGRSCLWMLMALLTGCAAREPVQIRVLTWNIHHGIGMDRRLDLERTQAVIDAVRPDLAALQEVDRGTRRSGQVDQLEVLARGTGMQPIFGKTIDFEGGEYGIAVLSRLPVAWHRVHPLPNTHGHEPRVLLEVGVDAGGRILVLFSTDLDDNREDAERFGSLEVLERALLEHPPSTPAILAGDLFVTPDQPLMQRLLPVWRDAALAGVQPDAPTVPADRPFKRIDYVLYRPAPALRCIACQVIPEVIAAQHRPVLAVFELR